MTHFASLEELESRMSELARSSEGALAGIGSLEILATAIHFLTKEVLELKRDTNATGAK
jgi:hypothetical protein